MFTLDGNYPNDLFDKVKQYICSGEIIDDIRNILSSESDPKVWKITVDKVHGKVWEESEQ